MVEEQASFKVFSNNAVAFWVQKWTEMCKQEDSHQQFFEFSFSTLQLKVQAAIALKVTKIGEMLSPSDILKQLSIYLVLYFTYNLKFLDFLVSVWFQLAKGE